MLLGQKVAVVLPAYNAAKTLLKTVQEIDRNIVDDLILTDDSSQDETVAIALRLGIHTIRHEKNRGYGGNQKTCYASALERGADIVVMLHPDYQYSPRLVPAMASMIVSGHYDAVIASRILGGGALKGGMPLYKYIANRSLTAIENMILSSPESIHGKENQVLGIFSQYSNIYISGFLARFYGQLLSANFHGENGSIE